MDKKQNTPKRKSSKKTTEKVKKKSSNVKKSNEKKSVKNSIDKQFGKTTQKSERENVKTLLLIIGFMVAGFLIVIFLFNSPNQFNHKGVEYQRINVGNLIFYRTSFPVINELGEYIEYRINIRNDPRKIVKDVPFEGELNVRENVVISFKDNFDCEGMGMVAIGNFERMSVFGLNIHINHESDCVSSNQYTFLTFKSGSKTKVEQIDNSCYEFTVKDCEIVKAMERFMVESFIKIHSQD